MSTPVFPRNLAQLAVALAVALPLVLLGAMSWMAYRDAERAALTRLDDLTRVMEEHAERALETNGMVFSQLQRVLNSDSEARVRSREAQLHELLSAICDRLPHIRSITIWSADGRVLVSSHVYPVPRSLTSADWQEYRSMPAPGVWNVSPVLVDRTTGEPYFRMAQARERGGVLELALQPGHFADFYSRLGKPGDHVEFRLVSGSGTVLAGAPAAPGQYQVSRGVGGFPLFVVASQPAREVFAPWRRQTTVLAAIAIPSALALLLASLLVLKRTRRMREAEEALRHSQKMEALGELTGGVAHDFGNVLAVVQNSAHLLELTDPQLKESRPLASIRKAVESGTRLTRQLLTFSRRQPLNPQILWLQRTLPAMTDLLKSTAGSRVALGLHAAPDTPAVEVDPNELEMALINLVANARDALERTGHIEILARAEPGYAVISVSDSGHGIAPDLLERVFEPFFTTKPAGSGTGLGLSQVYGFCRQAGGEVKLESDPGVGTTVSLYLPAARSAAPAATSVPSRPETRATPGCAHRMAAAR